eukprot:scaffold132_cov170-Amphora_coffeaeformis.AAC.21
MESVYELQLGIVGDTHLRKAFPSLGWASKNRNADAVAKDVEEWTFGTELQNYWKEMNEYICGLRQLGETKEEAQMLVAKARLLGERTGKDYEEVVRAVLAD